MFRKRKTLKLLKLIGLRGRCTPAASHDACGRSARAGQEPTCSSSEFTISTSRELPDGPAGTQTGSAVVDERRGGGGGGGAHLA